VHFVGLFLSSLLKMHGPKNKITERSPMDWPSPTLSLSLSLKPPCSTVTLPYKHNTVQSVSHSVHMNGGCCYLQTPPHCSKIHIWLCDISHEGLKGIRDEGSASLSQSLSLILMIHRTSFCRCIFKFEEK